MLTQTDINLLESKGISQQNVLEQIEYFKNGFPTLKITKAATSGEGIKVLSSAQIKAFGQLYDEQKSNKHIVKFVPASGAASRMFKALFEFLETKELNNDTSEIVKKITSLALFKDLDEVFNRKNSSLAKTKEEGLYETIIDYILSPTGLNYGNLPKGLLKFHLYDNTARTAFEEHLVEGVLYASGHGNEVNLHFTVSPEHKPGFLDLLNRIKTRYEAKYTVSFHVNFSEQKSSTDTVAVDKFNEPFRGKNGGILFRPGGHGALLDNLNDIKADIIFIKNIDNVVPDSLKKTTVEYKKALAGLLINIQNKINHYLEVIDNESIAPIVDIVNFIEFNLGFKFSDEFPNSPTEKQISQIKAILNRPLRVCGMVKNEGEPGGGPFWVLHSDGTQSLQILESSQFDLSIPDHKNAMESATHFNPVDLVCSTKDRFGKPFDLFKFRDSQTGFISLKSKDGKELKALELPGLWNGAMAFWNTAFVEVPIETFNPVKTINDLLRPQHLG